MESLFGFEVCRAWRPSTSAMGGAGLRRGRPLPRRRERCRRPSGRTAYRIDGRRRRAGWRRRAGLAGAVGPGGCGDQATPGSPSPPPSAVNWGREPVPPSSTPAAAGVAPRATVAGAGLVLGASLHGSGQVVGHVGLHGRQGEAAGARRRPGFHQLRQGQHHCEPGNHEGHGGDRSRAAPPDERAPARRQGRSAPAVASPPVRGPAGGDRVGHGGSGESASPTTGRSRPAGGGWVGGLSGRSNRQRDASCLRPPATGPAQGVGEAAGGVIRLRRRFRGSRRPAQRPRGTAPGGQAGRQQPIGRPDVSPRSASVVVPRRRAAGRPALRRPAWPGRWRFLRGACGRVGRVEVRPDEHALLGVEGAGLVGAEMVDRVPAAGPDLVVALGGLLGRGLRPGLRREPCDLLRLAPRIPATSPASSPPRRTATGRCGTAPAERPGRPGRRGAPVSTARPRRRAPGPPAGPAAGRADAAARRPGPGRGRPGGHKPGGRGEMSRHPSQFLRFRRKRREHRVKPSMTASSASGENRTPRRPPARRRHGGADREPRTPGGRRRGPPAPGSGRQRLSDRPGGSMLSPPLPRGEARGPRPAAKSRAWDLESESFIPNLSLNLTFVVRVVRFVPIPTHGRFVACRPDDRPADDRGRPPGPARRRVRRRGRHRRQPRAHRAAPGSPGTPTPPPGAAGRSESGRRSTSASPAAAGSRRWSRSGRSRRTTSPASAGCPTASSGRSSRSSAMTICRRSTATTST